MRNGSSPCGSCKLLRRRCTKTCILAPYFPPDDPYKFAIVHKIFGASNITKMLQELPEDQRADAVSSMVYEANARMRDPVYGCIGTISVLHNYIIRLEMQLGAAQEKMLSFQRQQQPTPVTIPVTPIDQDYQNLVTFSNDNSSNSMSSFQEVEDYYFQWT